MLASRSYIRFAHVVDLYNRVRAENDMGQKKASWNLDVIAQLCSYVPSMSGTSIRITPSVEEADYFTLYFPHDAEISYSTRFKNIRTLVEGEIIDSRWFQVVQINKHVSFSGQIQHIQVKIKSVIEP